MLRGCRNRLGSRHRKLTESGRQHTLSEANGHCLQFACCADSCPVLRTEIVWYRILGRPIHLPPNEEKTYEISSKSDLSYPLLSILLRQ